MRSYHDDTSDLTFGSPTKFGNVGVDGGLIRRNSMYRSKSYAAM